MDHQQLSLIPVSDTEFRQNSYQLALLLQQKEEAQADHKDTQKAYKELITTLDRGISEKRQVIRRAHLEEQEKEAQIDALLHQAREQSEEARDAKANASPAS